MIGLVLVLGVLLGALLAGYEARRTLHSELEAGMIGGQQTVLSAFEDLPRSDHAPRDLRQLIATFDGNRHVRALLTDGHGQVLLTSTPQPHSRDVPAWFSHLLEEPPKAIRIVAPAPVKDRWIRLEPIAEIDIVALWAEFKAVMIVLGLSVLGGLALTYLLIGEALRPLHALSDAFLRVGAGDYDARVAPRGPSDLLALQQGFNEMTAQLTAMADRNRKLETQLTTVQDEERADLARDLHDEIGPHLFAVNVDAELLAQLTGGAGNTAVADHLKSIQASVSHMQRLVRDMLGRLRPSRATELGLDAAIRDVVEFWTSRSPGVEIDYALLVDENRLGEALKDTLYRVVQEGLSNAMRHGEASRVAIRIEPAETDGIVATIADNGAAAPPSQVGGFGIIGMRERVRGSGGTLTIDKGAAGDGWTVVAHLPLQPEALAVDEDVDA